MPFDGSGNFNRVMDWTNDAAALIKIRADRHDQNDDDIAAGLSNTITKDGQTQPTANIPMNGKKLINLGAPTNPTDAATKGYADTQDATLAPKASPTFTGKVTLPTGTAALAPLKFPTAPAPTAPTHGDIWPDSTNGALRQFIVSTTFTYARLETAQTWTAAQTFNVQQSLNPATVGAIGQSGGNTGSAQIINAPTNAGAAAFISFNRTGVYAVNFGLDTDNQLKVGGWSMGANAYKIWHAGNDGAGSGLNADLLDGLQSSAANVASTVAARDGAGDLVVRLVRQEYPTPGVLATGYFNGQNQLGAGVSNHLLPMTPANALQLLSTVGVNQIGKFAFLVRFGAGGGQINPGDVVAGSTLAFTNGQGTNSGIAGAGSWRCHGLVNSGSTTTGAASLFERVS